MNKQNKILSDLEEDSGIVLYLYALIGLPL